MFDNKLLWHAIGTTYIAIAFAVLAKRSAEIAVLTYRDAAEYQAELIHHRMLHS